MPTHMPGLTCEQDQKPQGIHLSLKCQFLECYAIFISQSRISHCTTIQSSETPKIRISKTLLLVEESMKFLGLWWDFSNLLQETQFHPNSTKAKEIVITRLRIGHTKATKFQILPWVPQLLATTVVRQWSLITCSWSVVLTKSSNEY